LLRFQSPVKGLCTSRAFAYQAAGYLIDTVYPARMKPPFKHVGRDYLVYEYSRPDMVVISHFDNFDQPEQVADAINKFVRSAKR
jgi:hypothetical protein